MVSSGLYHPNLSSLLSLSDLILKLSMKFVGHKFKWGCISGKLGSKFKLDIGKVILISALNNEAGFALRDGYDSYTLLSRITQECIMKTYFDSNQSFPTAGLLFLAVSLEPK